MKNLSLKNRLSPTLVGLLCGAALAALPGVASAQLAENWENGVVAGKWRSAKSTSGLSLQPGEPGDAITLRSSIADDGVGAECAGRYARETRGAVAGHQYGIGTNIQAVTPNNDYCISAWVRAQPGSAPYIAFNYTGATGLADGVSKDVNVCYLASTNTGLQGGGCPGQAITAINPDGGWRWVAATFKARAGSTHVQTNFFNFCGDTDCGPLPRTMPGFDIDDIRLTAGVCPGAPPANTTAPHVACTGNTPVCTPGDATNNAKCAACTGNAGAAAPAIACPAATPVCQTAGADKGSCKTSCTSDFGGDGGAGACPETSPFCVAIGATALKECKPCAGNNGSATTPACPVVAPTCFTTGAKAGSCGRCTQQSDCGGATPRCDVGTGRCTDDCSEDVDCGDKKSGKICLASTLKCTDGCRGDAAGNGCPDGSKCSSVDLKPGTCTPEAQPDSGIPGVDASVPGVDSSVPVTPEVDSGTGETPATPVEEGGCSMSPGSAAGGGATMILGLGLAFAAFSRRRRND